MKIKILAVLFTFFIASFFSPIAKAQTETEGYGQVCLAAVRCDEAKDPVCKDKSSHKARLTLETPILPSTTATVIECFDVSGEDTFAAQVCTTGDSTIDNKLFLQDNTTILSTAIKYQFRGLSNNKDGSKISQPLISDAEGKLPIMEWEDYTPGNYLRKFYVIYDIPSGKGEDVAPTDEAKTQQQGSINFNLNQPGDDQSCIAISWDPYGRVFDNRSLEPIPLSVVELQKKRESGVFTKVNPTDPKDVPNAILKNPYTTSADGYFSFYVIDGTYKLELPVLLNKDISVVGNISKIHPNYSKIYSDIYPAGTGAEIIQKGVVEHRDIPVEVKGTATNNPVRLMEGSYELGKKSGKLFITGRVSHPLTVVKTYSKKIVVGSPDGVRGRLLQTVSADSLGRFSFTIDQSSFGKDEYYGEVELQKVNLTTFQLDNNKKIIKVDPILNYLQGYAYGKNGKILSKAEVLINLGFSQKPYYKTTTDEKGYYKISSINLPNFPYDIKYLQPNGQTEKISTSQFIAENAKYLSENKVNLNKINNEAITPNLSQNDNKKTNLTNKSAEETAANNKNNLILIAIVFLVLILGAISLIAVYLYKKNKQPPSF